VIVPYKIPACLYKVNNNWHWPFLGELFKFSWLFRIILKKLLKKLLGNFLSVDFVHLTSTLSGSKL